MTRTLLAVVTLAGLTADAQAQTYVSPVSPSPARPAWGRADVGVYNFNNPLYHGVSTPTAFYPGGYVSSQAYINSGSSVPTTYISHYRSLPMVAVPVVQTYYTEVHSYYPPPAYPYFRGRWR